MIKLYAVFTDLRTVEDSQFKFNVVPELGVLGDARGVKYHWNLRLGLGLG